MRNKYYIFAILKINADASYSFKGTGFIISKDGLFLTVAHNFKTGEYQKERFFCVFPSSDSILYNISFLEHDYIDNVDQKGPVYHDFAVGKIERKFTYYLTLKRKRPQVGDFQKVIGYVNMRLLLNRNIFNLKNNNKLDCSDIDFSPIDSTVTNRFAIISTDRYDYENNENLVNNSKKYNNCFTLSQAANHGVSGGPVFNADGTVSGIYFGGPDTHRICHCIAIKYARKKCRKLTKSKFNRYSENKNMI